LLSVSLLPSLSLSLDDVSTIATPLLAISVSSRIPVKGPSILALAEEYFGSKVKPGNKNSVRNLVRVTKAFIKPQNLDVDAIAKFLDSKSKYFDASPGATTRLQRLSQGLAKIDNHIIDVVGTIYFLHDIGQMAKLIAINGTKRKRGEKLKTSAFSISAKELSM
jgi:hypothetical protein